MEAIADSRDYDLYILTAPDFGFIQDGTREGEEVRLEMHEWLLKALQERAERSPFILAAGLPEKRLAEVAVSSQAVVCRCCFWCYVFSERMRVSHRRPSIGCSSSPHCRCPRPWKPKPSDRDEMIELSEYAVVIIQFNQPPI